MHVERCLSNDKDGACKRMLLFIHVMILKLLNVWIIDLNGLRVFVNVLYLRRISLKQPKDHSYYILPQDHQ